MLEARAINTIPEAVKLRRTVITLRIGVTITIRKRKTDKHKIT